MRGKQSMGRGRKAVLYTTAKDDNPQANHRQYKVAGCGPLLVYIPGLDGSGELFFKQEPALSRSYRVVKFQLREQGPFTYRDLADDVAAILDDLEEQRAVIVGESFGGGVALTFALHHPERVERLVIVNSFPRFRHHLRIRLAAWLARTIPFRITWLFRWVVVSVGLRLEGVRGEERRRFLEILRRVGQEGYWRRLRLISQIDIEDRLPEIQAPTLFIAGEKDLLVPSVREAQAMAARMPNATVKIIKGVGHGCLLGDKVCLADILAEALQDSRSSSTVSG